jgi:hypothetical protein
MKHSLAIAGCALSLAACSTMPSWMRFGGSPAAPAPTTMQFESEPAGAEARTSLGQTCRTPCSLAVTGTEFTVSFTLPGYVPQTVPVRAAPSSDPVDHDAGQPGGARLVPNPVFVELQPAAASPPPAARRRPAQQPAPARPPAPPPQRAPTAMAPQPAPAPAPASPWPPPR